MTGNKNAAALAGARGVMAEDPDGKNGSTDRRMLQGNPVPLLRALIRVACNPKLARGDVAVFSQILAHVNRKSGTAWPGIDRLSELCCVSRHTMINTIKKLEATDEINIVRVEGRSNEYRPTLTSAAECTGAVDCTGAAECTDQCSPATQTSAVQQHEPVQPAAPELALELALEPAKELAEKNARAARPEYPLFESGLRYLIETGSKDRAAKSFLGLLRSKVGDAEACRLVAEAERQRILDPRAWLSAAMKRAKSSVAQSFANKSYDGTPEHELPNYLRD